jgi:hypothetical protein
VAFVDELDGHGLARRAPASRKLGCDPQDIYGEGRCDFEVTFEIRQADGAPLEKVKLVLGNWKRRTDVGALAARLAAHGLERGTSVEMGDRLYTFGGGRKLVIDARDKRMRLRVLAADDRVIDERMLPPECPGRGAKTIWGAEAYWFERAGRLLVLPRGCARPTLQVVVVPR